MFTTSFKKAVLSAIIMIGKEKNEKYYISIFMRPLAINI